MTTFRTNHIIALSHLISIHTFKRKKQQHTQSKRKGNETECLF